MSALVAIGATTPASAASGVGYTIIAFDGCALARVDLATGATTVLGSWSSDACVFDLAFTPDGSALYGVRVQKGEVGSTATLVQFDPTTGATTDLGPVGDFPLGGPGFDQGNLTFANDGTPYTYLVPAGEEPIPQSSGGPTAAATVVPPECDGSAFCLFRLNLADPTSLTYVNHVPQEVTVYYGLATSCAGSTVSAHSGFLPASQSAWPSGPNAAAPAGQTLASVNLTSTGAATTDIGPVTVGRLSSLDFDSAGTLYGVGYDGSSVPSVFTVDPATGANTKVADLVIDDILEFEVLGFAVAHPCTPAPQPAADVVVAPRFTG
ncbi:MAG: hypothetical protein U0W40_16290 [Acidimicrobiia bacterium]